MSASLIRTPSTSSTNLLCENSSTLRTYYYLIFNILMFVAHHISYNSLMFYEHLKNHLLADCSCGTPNYKKSLKTLNFKSRCTELV